MLRYDAWANEATLRSLRQAEPPPRSLRWMAHIIGAELLWLARMRGVPSEVAVWPDLTLTECETLLSKASSQLRAPDLEKRLGPLTRIVSYTNSKGEPWTSTVEDILTHIVIHSAYHRGQIASDIRNAGQEPAYTDYIHAIRQGLSE
jgi:uncharacterized damage-inducible protein DinB